MKKHNPAHAWPLSALSLATLAALSGCLGGGGDSTPVPAVPATATVSGVVADGPLQGATACYDLNDNLACDAGEPVSAATAADGRYSVEIDAAQAGLHAVVVAVPATAIDADTGAPVGQALVLRAPATGSTGAQTVFVSALTEAVVSLAQSQGLDRDAAAARVQTELGLSVSPLADFTAANGDARAALAAKALTQALVLTTQLAERNSVPTAQRSALLRLVSIDQLALLADALDSSSADTAAAKAAEAVAVVQESLNLSDSTVAAVAQLSTAPTVMPDAPGPFVSVRRFAYTDADNHSFTVFTGDNSVKDADGAFSAHEVRQTLVNGQPQAFNRNQLYWTGSAWLNCALQWQVSTGVKTSDDGTRQTSLYCGGSRSDSQIKNTDISGRTLREVVAQVRAFPLADNPGPHTDAQGLPVNWGPNPQLLPADAVFPEGARLSTRQVRADVGGTDRIELSNKPSVRWPDGRYRQATALAQYSGMAGDLVDSAVVPGNANTVYVADVPLAEQPDASLEAFKRYRAAFDVAGLKLRFYRCNVRKADQAAIQCATAGDGTLALSSQGDAQLMRVASGYPAELRQRLNWQRFWAEHSGTVFRGATDLPRTRHDQRLNKAAWDALRTALAIPEPAAATAPAGPGPASILRNFTFTDAANYDWRVFAGDSSQLDADGYYLVRETRRTVVGGVLQPTAATYLYWTGDAWYDCGADPDAGTHTNARAPFDFDYCKSFRYEAAGRTTLTLAGRLMSDVVNDIRAYGSLDGSASYAGWGPDPAVQTQLASLRFPAGATMEYRGSNTLSNPWTLSALDKDRVRVPATVGSSEPFNTWPFADSLELLVARYPGDLRGGPLNGATAQWVADYRETPPASSGYTDLVEYRVSYDANGQRARFTRNNRLASTNGTTNHQVVLDTTYSIETIGGLRVLRFAAVPPGMVERAGYERQFGEVNGVVRYGWKLPVPSGTTWSIRLNGTAANALAAALGI